MTPAPKVKFISKNQKDTFKTISSFFNANEFLDSITAKDIASMFKFDINFFYNKTYEERYNYIKKNLKLIYKENLKLVKQKVNEYQEYWNQNEVYKII